MGQTTLSQSIDVTEKKVQYDAACKKILAEKIILAWVMKHTMDEYRVYEVPEIAEKFIIGEPQIGEIPVLPDETNAPRITGVGVEDSSLTEGSVTYDIQFRAFIPDSKDIAQMIINVEAQNDFYPGYPLVKRGIYYGARMISSQYGTVFTNSHYEKIQKVYSVWICMEPPKERMNSITEYVLTEKNYIGNVKERNEYYDLLTVIMVCLGKRDEKCESDLLGLLDVLLSPEMSAAEKKEIMESDYHIPMTEKMEGEMEYMCNLSDGVEQRGIEKGIKIGIEQGIEQQKFLIVMNMLKANESIDKICLYTQCEEAYVLQLKEELAQSI
ncbi:MAG: hypothetical protein IJO60_00660 [Agathobacter sp.]|nr:hypothetical protein [Agathobacter sp.]